MRLPETDAERLLLKHWTHLRFTSYFVQAALYVATPRLLEAARAAIHECPEPETLLKYVSQHFGIRVIGRPGLTRDRQLRALAPYLHLVSSHEIRTFWEACNDLGWFAVRRELLDDLLKEPFPRERWNRDDAVREFDEMVADSRQVWTLDFLIDSWLKGGTPWSEVIATMITWLEERRSIGALRVFCAALEHHGTRDDLRNITIFDGMPAEATAIVANTQFAVRRRSLH